MFSYPNINTYLTSYMRTNGYNPNLTYDDFVFLTTTKVILQGVSMPFVGHLCRIIGCRWSILIGSVIYRSHLTVLSSCQINFPFF